VPVVCARRRPLSSALGVLRDITPMRVITDSPVGSAVLTIVMGLTIGLTMSVQTWLQRLAIKDSDRGVKLRPWYGLVARMITGRRDAWNRFS